MIKTFLFDYGGVVTTGGAGDELTERLAANLKISTDESLRLFDFVWDDLVTGKLSEPELWQVLEKNYGQPIPMESRDIWNRWEQHMQPLPEMLDLVSRLKSGGYTVGLLSNVIPLTAADIRDNHGYATFDPVFLSCEVGYAKPDKKIYEFAVNHLSGVRPDEVVFIDDQEKFLVPARDFGMQTILAHDPDQITEDINKLFATIGQ